MPDPLQLITNRTDKEIAEDLKRRVIEAWQPLLSLMEEANSNGFNIQVNAGMSGLGKAMISNIIISKNF